MAVSKPNLNIQLKTPEQINADKIANKRIMGIRVLSSSQRKEVYKGRDGIDDAQYKVKDTQNKIDDSANKTDSACNQGEDTEDQKNDGVNQEGTSHSADAQGKQLTATTASSSDTALSHIEELENAQEEFDELSETILEDNEADYEILEESSDALEDFSTDIEDLNAELEALTSESTSEDAPVDTAAPAPLMAAPAPAPVAEAPVTDGMGGVVDANFDGTGSGANSAYSLSTATETEENNQEIAAGRRSAPAAPAPAPAPIAPAPVAQAPVAPAPTETAQDTPVEEPEVNPEIKEKEAEIEDKEAEAEELGTTFTETNDAITERSEEQIEYATTYAEDADAIVQEGEEANEGTAKARAVFGKISEVGQFTQQVGNMTEFAGKGLQATGLIIQTCSDSTATLSGTLGILASTLFGIGTPLVPVFGSGTGIVAGGTTTGVSSGETGTTSVILSGTAKGLYQAGTVTEQVGHGIGIAGKATSAIGSAGTTVCDIADGNWLGAITNGLSAASNGLAVAGGLGDVVGEAGELSKSAKETIDTIQKGISTAQSTIQMGVAISEGNVEGMITGAASVAGNAFSLGGNEKAGNLINGAVGVYSNGKATVEAVADGNILGAVMNGMSTVQNGLKVASNMDGIGGKFGEKLQKGVNKLLYKETPDYEEVKVYEKNEDGTDKVDGQGNKIVAKNEDGTDKVIKQVKTYDHDIKDKNGNVIHKKGDIQMSHKKGEEVDVKVYYEKVDKDGNKIQVDSKTSFKVDTTSYATTGSILKGFEAAGAAVGKYNEISGYIDQAKNMTIFGGGGEVTYSEEAESLTTGKEIDMNGTNGKKKKYSQAEIDALLSKYGMGDYYTSLLNGNKRRASF